MRMASRHATADIISNMQHNALPCTPSGTPPRQLSANIETYAFLRVMYAYSSLSCLSAVPGSAPNSDFDSIMREVAAISTSCGRKPTERPSTFTRKRSPASSRFPPTSDMAFTIWSYPFSTMRAMMVRSTPKSIPTAVDAKTGSCASTSMTSPSRRTDV